MTAYLISWDYSYENNVLMLDKKKKKYKCILKFKYAVRPTLTEPIHFLCYFQN